MCLMNAKRASKFFLHWVYYITSFFSKLWKKLHKTLNTKNKKTKMFIWCFLNFSLKQFFSTIFVTSWKIWSQMEYFFEQRKKKWSQNEIKISREMKQ